jgi:hypothetical protein
MSDVDQPAARSRLMAHRQPCRSQAYVSRRAFGSEWRHVAAGAIEQIRAVVHDGTKAIVLLQQSHEKLILEHCRSPA